MTDKTNDEKEKSGRNTADVSVFMPSSTEDRSISILIWQMMPPIILVAVILLISGAVMVVVRIRKKKRIV